MYITVIYKEPPELSLGRRTSQDFDISVEKNLLVNPICHVRVMLEYIRNICNLGIFATFDLCDDAGILRGLFKIEPYEYAHNVFENGRYYYLVVFKTDVKQPQIPIPQINWSNPHYADLTQKIKAFMSASLTTSAGKSTPPSLKLTPKSGSPSKSLASAKSKGAKSAKK